MDLEQVENLEKDLDRVAEIQHPYYTLFKSKRRRHLTVVKDKDDKEVVAVPTKKWKAPPGWTPPGWNEAQSYAAAKSFMGFQANPGGKKK